MKLSNQLAQDHNSGDFGMALEGYFDKARRLEDEIDRLKEYIDVEKLNHIEAIRAAKEQGYHDGKIYEKQRIIETLGLTT